VETAGIEPARIPPVNRESQAAARLSAYSCPKAVKGRDAV